MLTKFRIAAAGFTPFILMACLLALGSFDTVEAQNLTVGSTTLAFNVAQGGSPSVQTVTTGSTGGSINFSISYTASWISAGTGLFNGTTGTSGQTLTVTVAPGNMASGNYNTTITLTPQNSSAPVDIAVNLTISGSGASTYVLSPSLANLYFAYELNQSAPPSQTVQITSSGIALPITSVVPSVTPSTTCPPGWLQVTASGTSTPAALTVSVNTTGLGAGTCGGKITVTSTTQANGTTSIGIPVLLFISANATLIVNIPAGLTQVTLHQGDPPQKFNIQITSSDPAVALNYTASASNAPWLAPPAPSSGSTPASPYVQITPGLVIAAGVYNGSVTINSPTLFGGSLTIPIMLTLLSSSAVTISPPGAQSFTELQGGSVPAPVTLTITGTTSSSFTTQITPGPAGGDWLQVTPQTATIAPGSPASLTLSIAPNTLGQGTYSSTVTITFIPSTIPAVTLFVGLTVGPPAAALVATPSAVSFSYQTGGAAPPTAIVGISNAATGVAGLAYTIGSISDSWISVSPGSGTTPGSVAVSVTPQNLQPGMHNGSFTLSASGVAVLTVPVSVFVSATSTPQPFIIGNNSSGVGGQVSPGEIIWIKGSGLGPALGVTGAGTNLGGVQVAFNNNNLGTMLYASSTQIDVVVPYEIGGQTAASIVITYQGVPSTAIQLPVVSAALGLSTDSQTGTGQAAVLNQNYSLNTASNPALEGSYISVYGTGGGQTNPPSLDGEITPLAQYPLVLQPFVTATIGGKNATVVYAGAAPGLVTGVVQFNLQVPTGVNGSALPIVISINGVQSQAGVTVAVQ